MLRRMFRVFVRVFHEVNILKNFEEENGGEVSREIER